MPGQLLTHTQQQTLSPAQQQSLTILQRSVSELEEYLSQVILENPLIELEPPSAPEETPCRPDRFLPRDSGRGETFREHLRRQLPQISRRLPARYLPLCAYVVDSLDARGYLDDPLDLLAASAGVPEAEMLQAVFAVQTLSPPGTAARSLEECLILQLTEGPNLNRYTLELVRSCLPLIAADDMRSISKKLALPLPEAERHVRAIRALNPIPSNGFASERDTNTAVIPEAAVTEEGGRLLLHYRREALPRLAESASCRALLAAEQDRELQQYLERCAAQLHRLRRDLDDRADTVTAVLRQILAVQESSLLRGEPLRPLAVQDLAQALGLHPSTVSRAIQNKYITVRGRTLPVRELLSRRAGDGGAASRAAVRVHLERLISGEDPGLPLSDESLQKALAGVGIRLSRRSVADYRRELGIPSSYRRRRAAPADGHTEDS